MTYPLPTTVGPWGTHGGRDLYGHRHSAQTGEVFGDPFTAWILTLEWHMTLGIDEPIVIAPFDPGADR